MFKLVIGVLTTFIVACYSLMWYGAYKLGICWFPITVTLLIIIGIIVCAVKGRQLNKTARKNIDNLTK